MTTRTRNERRYDMKNEQVNKFIWPGVFATMMAIVSLLFTIAYLGGQQVSNTENTDKNVEEIKIQIKENRVERINSYNKLYDSYDVLNNKVDNLSTRANYYWPETKNDN